MEGNHETLRRRLHKFQQFEPPRKNAQREELDQPMLTVFAIIDDKHSILRITGVQSPLCFEHQALAIDLGR